MVDGGGAEFGEQLGGAVPAGEIHQDADPHAEGVEVRGIAVDQAFGFEERFFVFAAALEGLDVGETEGGGLGVGFDGGGVGLDGFGVASEFAVADAEHPEHAGIARGFLAQGHQAGEGGRVLLALDRLPERVELGGDGVVPGWGGSLCHVRP